MQKCAKKNYLKMLENKTNCTYKTSRVQSIQT